MTLRLFFALGVIALLGCGGGGPPANDPALSHTRILTMFYNKATQDLGHMPKDEAEFKQALANATILLEPLKLESVDAAFTSERDGQPLVVAYGGPPAGSDIVVYEQTGVDGLRYVGHRIGNVELVDAAKFKELVPAPAAAK